MVKEGPPPTLNAEMAAIAEERANPMFPIREMTYFLDGSKEMTELREKFMLDLERDRHWRLDDFPNLTLPQMRERTMAKARLVVHFLANEPVEVFRKRMAIISVVDPAFWTRLGVHYGLFLGTLQGQATPKQLEFWITKGALALNGVIGCFAMTELGHGSNVAGLETTATYDEASDEFIIHTPTLTATKWWIGGAAQTCTHAAVYAQLIVKGKTYGVKSFIVPLRDPNDFSLKPGVRIGDCGKKLGRDGIDNGYITFTHVRVPRSHMLMKHTQVHRDGTVVEPPLPQLAYGALIQGRVAMVVDSGNTGKKALTIAIRYACIRRQFSSQPGQLETKLLDYRIHQSRLFPLLAQTFAMHFAGVEMDKMYVNLMEQFEQASPGQAMDRILETLKETHATSAGLKAFCTWTTLNIIEQCRQSLGGHGFSEYSGLATMLKDWTVQCTWEGDNTILALQAGRYLISCYRELMKGKPLLSPGVQYLAQAVRTPDKQCTESNLLQREVLLEAFDLVAARAVIRAANEFMKARKELNSVERAYEECARARFQAAKLHSYTYLLHRFADGLAQASSKLLPILELLFQLYAAHTILEEAGMFLQFNYFLPHHIEQLHSHVNQLLPQIRPLAVPLVDSFNYSDYVLNTPLGRYDGNIYEHYMRRVRRLNPTADPHPYFQTLIRPLLTRDLKVEDAPEI